MQDPKKTQKDAPRRAWTGRAVLAAALLLVPGVLAGVSTSVTDPLDRALYDATLRTHLRDYELHLMDPTLVRDQLDQGAMDLTLRGVSLRVLVEPTPWDANLAVAVPREDGMFEYQLPAFTTRAFIGHVEGDPGSFVHVVVTGAGVVAQISTAEHALVLEPLRYLVPGAPAAVAVAYHAHEAVVPAAFAHAHPGDAAGLPDLPPPEGDGIGISSYAPGPDRAMALFTDDEMRATHPDWDNRIRTMMSTVNAHYARMVGFQFTIVQNAIYNCPSTHCSSTDAGTLLNQFGAYVNQPNQAWATYELAHLFTRKNIEPLGVAKQPGRYGLTSTRSSDHINNIVMAHEVGHNFNGRHHRANHYTHLHSGSSFTHRTIMWSGTGDGGTLEYRWEFSSSNANWMRACNVYSWNQAPRDPTGVGNFDARCSETGASFTQGGINGAFSSAGTYQGKYFYSFERGFLSQVCIYVSGPGYAFLQFKQFAHSTEVLAEAEITAEGAGAACTDKLHKYWNHATLFVYKAAGDAPIRYDEVTSGADGYTSTDWGTTWTTDNTRRGYSINIIHGALPRESCPSGLVSTLGSTETLGRDRSIYSCSGQYRLTHQNDGNVVLYNTTNGVTKVDWATHTPNVGTTGLVMQGDGNLVLYDNSIVRWASNTAGHSGAWLSLRNDGVLVIYGYNGTTLWMEGCGLLGPNSRILRGYEIRSCSREYSLAHQLDGNVVLYRNGVYDQWATNTNGWSTNEFKMQDDGNLVLYAPPYVPWASDSPGNPNSVLRLTDQGRLFIMTPYGDAICHKMKC